MNIIFGKDNTEFRVQLTQLRQRFIVLELDTLLIGDDSEPVESYCVIENIPLDQMSMLEEWQDMHELLIKNYKGRTLKFCDILIEQLKGAWNSQLDSYYEEIKQRIDKLLLEKPDKEWTYIVRRQA